MKNPWLDIDYRDYEEHMSHDAVYQLQVLNNIVKAQFDDYRPETLFYLGVATGNGLEHIDNNTRVYGVDINQSYLDIVKSRYSDKNLELLNIDLNSDYFRSDSVDLVIANLVIEFIDLERFFEQLEIIKKSGTVISVVLQDNNNCSFVANSGVDSLNVLSSHFKSLEIPGFIEEVTERGYKVVYKDCYTLQSGKRLVRIDFK